MYGIFKYRTLPLPLTCGNIQSESRLAVRDIYGTRAVNCSAGKKGWPIHEEQLFHANKRWRSTSATFAEEMGAPSSSAILTWTVIAAEDKPASIAIGWEPDLFFKVDVNRLEASDTKVIVAVFHFRGMWTETKRGRLQNYHHNLSPALCVILKSF